MSIGALPAATLSTGSCAAITPQPTIVLASAPSVIKVFAIPFREERRDSCKRAVTVGWAVENLG